MAPKSYSKRQRLEDQQHYVTQSMGEFIVASVVAAILLLTLVFVCMIVLL